MKKINCTAVFDFLPKFCPGCGKELHWAFSLDEKGALVSDWKGGASHSCDCGLGYQKATTEDILSIAEDLKYYYQQA